MDCNTCKDRQVKAEPVTYLAFESMKATLERTIKRLWILLIVLVILLFGTNAAWIYYESQWETVTTTEITQENADGYNNYIGNNGDIYNGQTDYKDDTEPQA